MAKDKELNSNSVFSRRGIMTSLVLVTQAGVPLVAAASPGPDVPLLPLLKANDFTELEISISDQNSTDLLPEVMKDWSSRAFLSLMPMISSQTKMRAALLKMRTIVHEEFLTEDLVSLSSQSQKAVAAAFFLELERYTERVSLLSQAITRSEDPSIRELAKSVLIGIIERAPQTSHLREYLRLRTAFEVSLATEKDAEFARAVASLNSLPKAPKVKVAKLVKLSLAEVQ